MYTEEQKKQIHKHSLRVVILSQTLGGLGLAAGITVGALIAQDLLKSDTLAGLPLALFTLGSALAALLVGRITQKNGRRLGLSAGFIIGGLGALGVIFSTAIANIFFLFLSLFIYGFGTATNLQARYAGSDLAEPEERSRSISLTMVATTFGAVLGPNLSGVMAKVALALGLPALTGSFILSAIAYLSAGLILFFFLRPDPFIVAKELAVNEKTEPATIIENKLDLRIGAFILIASHLVMVAIMTMTPIHMKSHGHMLGTVGLVIGIHIGSMYLPSLITGSLVQKIGPYKMGIYSGLTLLAAALLALIAPASSTTLLTIALSLLGIGWNFGLISGTTIVVNATSLENRAKTQGSIDVFVALAGALAGILSGFVVDHYSFGALSILGGMIALLLVGYLTLFYKKVR